MARLAVTDRKKKRSLRTSIMVVVCGIVVFASLIFSVSQITFVAVNKRDVAAEITSKYADSYTLFIEAALTHADYEDLQNHIDMIQRELSGSTAISAYQLVGANDIHYFESSKEKSKALKSQSLSELQEITDIAATRDETITIHTKSGVIVAKPIFLSGYHAATFTIQVPYSAVGFSLFKAALWTILATCLLIIVAIPVSILLVNKVTNPLRKLTDFASNIQINQLSSRVEVNAGNEFDTLADAFNSMMRRVDTSMRYVQKLAFVDSVTDMPNRESFLRNLNRALQGLKKDRYAAVIILNVDRFRWVNETMGPEKGDEVLSLIGMRIRKAVATADKTVRLLESKELPSMVARLAGDEFAVLVPSMDAKSDISRLMQMIISSMRQPLEMGGQTITLGLSGGIALAPVHGSRAEDLIKNADLALKEARRAGRGKARFYSSKLNQIAMDRLHLEADLRRAIERDEFIPFFQPKVSFKTGAILGAEALVRWQRTDGDLISPGIFIPMAEQLGLISKIGNSVLRQACQEATRWMKSGHDCKVAVNVSPLQFEEADFAEKVLSALRDAGLPPGRLELEITETMAVGDTERVTEIMRPLRAMGVRLAIDDFGAGHSNLVTLTRLPFDVFKIDQQFVSALHSDKQAPAIIDMILAMAETMGLETVAEGVETPSQSDFLRRRGCTLAQGYLYSKPIPPDDFMEFLDHWHPFGEIVDEGLIQKLSAG